jgi:hypothetical protein
MYGLNGCTNQNQCQQQIGQRAGGGVLLELTLTTIRTIHLFLWCVRVVKSIYSCEQSVSNHILIEVSNLLERPAKLLICDVQWWSRVFSSLVTWCLAILAFQAMPLNARASTEANATITVDAANQTVSVFYRSAVPLDRWSFRNAYASVVGLGNRIRNLKAFDPSSKPVSAKRLTAGEYLIAEKVTGIRYEVALASPVRWQDKSHVSWISTDESLLMMADLLPIRSDSTSGSLLINFELPADWRVFSSAGRSSIGFLLERPDQALFLAGKDLRERKRKVEGTELTFLTKGQWSFSDSEALSAAAKMIKEYTRLTRFPLSNPYFILLPSGVRGGATGWSAEVRGNSVVLFLQPGESRRQSLATLGVILTHEIFHLWVPNSLKLVGDYDWFFEGFTLYQALRTALKVGLIDFQEYLNTIGRVYDSYLAAPEHGNLSLIELSKRRWTTSPRVVYDKGMLVAFLYDLSLRGETSGKTQLSDLYRQLFQSDGVTTRDANEVIMSTLNQGKGVRQLLDRLVMNSGSIDLDLFLTPLGITVERNGSKTRLSVNRNLQAKQRGVLRSLGYKG